MTGLGGVASVLQEHFYSTPCSLVDSLPLKKLPEWCKHSCSGQHWSIRSEQNSETRIYCIKPRSVLNSYCYKCVQNGC